MAIVRKVFTDNSGTSVKQKADQTYKAMHSNNTTVQNAKNRLSQLKRLRSRRKGPKSGKEGFSLPYISYNLHYTKYYNNQKQRPPSPAFRHRCRFWEPLRFFISFRLGRVDRLPSRHRKIQLDKTAFTRASIASDFTAVYPAAVFQSMHRSLHSKRAPLSYSLLRCQTVQRPLRWSQSTVLPEPPDSLHLPTR